MLPKFLKMKIPIESKIQKFGIAKNQKLVESLNTIFQFDNVQKTNYDVWKF